MPAGHTTTYIPTLAWRLPRIKSFEAFLLAAATSNQCEPRGKRWDAEALGATSPVCLVARRRKEGEIHRCHKKPELARACVIRGRPGSSLSPARIGCLPCGELSWLVPTSNGPPDVSRESSSVLTIDRLTSQQVGGATCHGPAVLIRSSAGRGCVRLSAVAWRAVSIAYFSDDAGCFPPRNPRRTFVVYHYGLKYKHRFVTNTNIKNSLYIRPYWYARVPCFAIFRCFEEPMIHRLLSENEVPV